MEESASALFVLRVVRVRRALYIVVNNFVFVINKCVYFLLHVDRFIRAITTNRGEIVL